MSDGTHDFLAGAFFGASVASVLFAIFGGYLS